MGCGTAPLGDREPFVATLTFDEPIDPGSKIYQDFKSALNWLLRGLEPGGGFGSIEEIPGPGPIPITSLKVKVTGPLNDPTDFNRAFNRLLWGVRHRLTDARGNRSPGTPSRVIVTASPENWRNEET